MPSPYDAVILDMDGLILDTEARYRQAWRSAAGILGFELDDTLLKKLSGLSVDAVETILCRALGPGFDFKRFLDTGTRCWHAAVAREGIPVKPGFGDLLATLKRQRLPFALATNSHRPDAENCLNLAGIQAHFPIIVTRSEVAHGKPAPDIYLKAAEQLALAPENCLAVEDSEAGLLAAFRAGMQPVWIPDYAPVSETAQRLAAARFSSLDQLAHSLNLCPLNAID
ncbi:MAG: HAD family hydrolase [Methylohalobius sp. ZOD2]